MTKHPTKYVITEDYHPFFFTCEQAAIDLAEIEAEIEAAEPATEKEITWLMGHRESAILTAIVFGVVAADNFIYLYGTRYLGIEYIQRYLEKLDVHSRWVVVPKLCCGQELAATDMHLNALRELIATRNRLVHTRSSARWAGRDTSHEDIADKARNDLEAESRNLRKVALNAPKTLVGLAESLKAIDSGDQFMSVVECLAWPLSRT